MKPIIIAIIVLIGIITACGSPPPPDVPEVEATAPAVAVVETVAGTAEVTIQIAETAVIPTILPSATDVMEATGEATKENPTLSPVHKPTEIATTVAEATKNNTAEPTMTTIPVPIIKQVATITPIATKLFYVTSTPIPPSNIRVISKKPLLLDGIMTTKGTGSSNFYIHGWTQMGDVVIQPIISNTKISELPIWAINPNNGNVVSLQHWNFVTPLIKAHQQIINDFLTSWQGKPEFVRWYPSSKNQYLALLTLQEDQTQNVLYIYHIGKDIKTITLPIKSTNSFKSPTVFPPVWSPDGSKLAYSVMINKTSYPLESYELHINDLDTGEQIIITPVYHKGIPMAITWSPDGQYIAFVAQRGDHAPYSLFAVKSDGTNLTDLTPDTQYWAIDIAYWSPTNDYIAYGVQGNKVWLAKISIK